jgi:tetratricopeptide (TPR) repeat protein
VYSVVKFLFILIATGMILFGCAGTRSAQINPGFDGLTPGGTSYAVPESGESSLQPQYDLDGSITLFSKGNIRFSIMPMTMNGATRGALPGPSGEFDTLIKRYEADLAANPRDFDTCIMLAGLYINRGRDGDADLAVRYCNTALAVRRGDAEALYARGLAYNAKGESAPALVDLVAVLRTDIQSMKGVYYIMGMIYYNDGKIDEAIESFEKVKTIDPEFVDIDEILEMLYQMKV